MPTRKNLQDAFAGESQANRKYLAYAQKAEKDGLGQVAKLFRAAAEAETVHAHAHLRVLGQVRSTAENLQDAIDGEGYEFKDMYPQFLAEAEREDDKPAQTTFRYALEVEKIHYELYKQALQAVQAGNDLPEQSIYVCPVCGFTHVGEPPRSCPICSTPGERFFEVS